jgi:hypothetical protein
MDRLSIDDVKELREFRDGLRISIYMPTHRMAQQTRQDPIRFKNLLHRAEEQLLDHGLRTAEAKAFLEQAAALLGDREFWQHQGDGLALFVSGDTFRRYRVFADFQELVVVGERFYVKPLLPLVSGHGRFYVLAVSQNEVRLLLCTRHNASRMELQNIPASLAEAMKYDDPERQLQFHTGTSAGGGDRPAMFHGQGVGTDDNKTKILEFFRQIDKGLQEMLRDEKAPIVLAGVDYLFPLYREVNSLPTLLDEGIPGNPERSRDEQLQEKAWKLVEPFFQKARREAANEYRQRVKGNRASSDFEEVIPAAYHGRVSSLFVAADAQVWGRFYPNTNEIEIREKPRPGDGELLDLAAVQTLFHGGTVYVVDAEEMPGEGYLAAIFRY